MAVKVAPVAAPNVAAIATSATAPGDSPRPGNAASSPAPTRPPNEPPMSSNGASVPPDVPEPRAIHHMTSLASRSSASAPTVNLAASTSSMASYPTPSARGTASPITANPRAPMIGCQNSEIGSRR
jgi:hypothetical protein